MWSLRAFHMMFIVFAIVGADLVGLWGVWQYTRSGDSGSLLLGAVSLLGGLGLVFYAIRVVRTLDRIGE